MRALPHIAGAAQDPVDGSDRDAGRFGQVANGRTAIHDLRVCILSHRHGRDETNETIDIIRYHLHLI